MNIHDYLLRGDGANEPEPSAREIQQALAADPEGARIVDYLTNALSPEERAEVEQSLRDDAAFRERAMPIIEAWNAWPTAKDFTLSGEERDASSARFVAKWEAHQRAREERDDDVALSPQAMHEGRRAGEAAVPLRRLRRWQLAAAAVTLLGLPAAGWFGFSTAQRLAPPRTYTVVASDRAVKQVDVGMNVIVALDPGARLVWSEAPGLNGARELYLDGAARVDAPTLDPGRIAIITASGHLNPQKARFHVDATDPAATRVSVQQGIVIVTSRSRSDVPLLPIMAGQEGMALHNQAPRLVR